MVHQCTRSRVIGSFEKGPLYTSYGNTVSNWSSSNETKAELFSTMVPPYMLRGK